jgi:hypothetical protein
MNYDTILPEKIRTRLERQSSKKPLKLFYKITIALLLLAGLRHFNTVPHREWTGHTRENSAARIYTAEEIFGSSYRGQIRSKSDLWEDIGINSKRFEDIFVVTTKIPYQYRANVSGPIN